MQSWKFTIKPDSVKGYDAFEKCHDLGMVGIGWSEGYKDEQPLDEVHSKKLIKKVWGKDTIPQIETLFKTIQPGDHLWMHKNGFYYLCVVGEEHYLGRKICPDFLNYDLGHAIEAKWLKVPDGLVSGSIQRGVIARRMIQRIHLSDVEVRLNKYLQENLERDSSWCPTFDGDSNVATKIEGMSQDDLFRIMSPDDVEDVIAAKLQTEGWILLKSTCFRSKPKFEFSMINKDGRVGLVQVKSGDSDQLKPSDYKDYLTPQNEVFLFSTHPNPYPDIHIKRITCLTKEGIIEWMKSNYRLLPPTLQIKLSLK